ncbi:MAG: hypothetical protein MJ096_06170 [Clostridia bacterium]|nr:hypothetical protein [Clostridia bacterium]
MCLFGCGRKKYNVDYRGQKDFFTGAEDSYAAGEKVKLYYDLIATDTDYTFYVDGERVRVDWNENKGFIIKFTMPDHDIEVYCESVNTMIRE